MAHHATHVRTADSAESYCEEWDEFDVRLAGDTVSTGPQPVDYCRACNAAEPEWEIITAEEFLKRFPL